MTAVLSETESNEAGFSTAQSALSDAIQGIVASFQRMNAWRCRRLIEARARALSDHQRRDIGVYRADIGFIALGQTRLAQIPVLSEESRRACKL